MRNPLSAIARARELILAGRHTQADPILRRVLQRDPDDFLANHLLSAALMHGGQAEQALFFARRAASDPRADAGVFDVLGTIHVQLHQFDEARAAFEKAVVKNPSQASAWNGLGSVLRELNDAPGACEALSRACQLIPGNVSYQVNLAGALNKAWRTDDCRALLQRQIALHPDNADLRSMLASLLNYVADATPEEIFEQHRQSGRLLSRAASKVRDSRKALGADAAEPLRDRPIRIGFLSPDLRDHSVTHFLLPFLKKRSKSRVCVACYFCGGKADAVTDRVRSLADLWRDIFPLDDQPAAATIHKDHLDILFDLAGHTAGTRLPMLALKPAPVMATYLGYPNTTGLPEIDFRVVDSNTDPLGAERFATERLIRLDPCFLCFSPPLNAPGISPAPSGSSSTITFGSFNAAQKLNQETLAMWGDLLRACPDSRLILKGRGMDDPALSARLRALLDEAGIGSDRSELIGMIPSETDHLAVYNRIDIALDPFPYHGTTTTCQALWMGVPVLSRAGRTHASRVGVTLLRAVGLEDLITSDREEFVSKGVALARDVERRGWLRRTLRDAMASSVLCDEAGFAERFEAAARRMCELVGAPAGGA